jgi:hypothetical protein
MPQLIPPPELYSLLVWFAPCFTAPSIAHFVSFVVCLMANLARGTSTTVYRTSPRASHWTNYSRFLSQYRWSVQALSARLLELLLDHCDLRRDDQGRRRLCVVIDETIVEKTSRRMFGVAWQRNTHGSWCHGSHILGHYWLMVGLLVRIGGRTLCLPLAFGLYRQKKRCPADAYRTPCQLALQLLGSLPWPTAPDLVRTVIADAGFADKELLRWCDANGFVAIVRGRIDAQVHDLYVRQPEKLRGRPRKYGERISLPEYTADSSHFRQTIALYQNRTPVRVASLVGLHRASGLSMRFVILRCAGKPDRVVMSTDLSLTPREIAGLYADRFAIEMTFRELKQHFGLGHYQARLPEAMLRHVQLSGVACALTQLLTLQPPPALCNGLGHASSSIGTIVKATPWRRYHTRSVGETQLWLRLACAAPATLGDVALSTDNCEKHRQASRPAHRPIHAPKSAEL